jgi:hypothetical protein
LSRVIRPVTIGKERERLVKSIVVALREFTQQKEINQTTKDLAAFIALALLEISNTVESTVIPWEKRGYWVKADRFRMQWVWTGDLGQKMLRAVKSENWAEIAAISALIGQKLSDVNVSTRHRLGYPWVGAWEKLKQKD